MKTSKANAAPANSPQEFGIVDPFLFGVTFNDVDVAFRGGVYAIRPSRSSVNPQTGFPTHGVYCIQNFEILDGDFAGEIRKKSYYVGGLAGSIPKGTPPRVLLVPSVDGKTFVGGLSPEDVIALAIGTLTFGEEDFADYEGKHLLQPKDRNVPLRQDSQYGQLVESVKGLYKVGKNGTPQEIAYGTTFPGILAGNKGPDFALNYGFHMRLEGEEFKTLVAVSALGEIPPSANAQVQAETTTQVAVSTNVTPVTNGYTKEKAQALILRSLMAGPKKKNEVITELMNGAAPNEQDAIVAILLAPGTFDSDSWELGADSKYSLK